ncbi:MAG: RluA family pseudouridine synthase [Planctomycetales bacterium]|nr:RluA family pseudouridine synthase [Planctomycetales bacterium]
MPPLSVLYEDNHLLVVDKCAGLATMGLAPGEATVARAAAEYLKRRYRKPGNAFVGVVSRLDRLVSGVLVLARTSKGASRLSQQIREHRVEKRYVAMVEGPLRFDGPPTAWREICDFVAKDEAAHRMRVVDRSRPGAQLARLKIRVLGIHAGRSLVEIDLLTGRKHQIRLQLAELGHAVLGDTKYGAQRKPGPGIALHCRQTTLLHPTRKEPLTFSASAASHWPRAPAEFLRLLDSLS